MAEHRACRSRGARSGDARADLADADDAQHGAYAQLGGAVGERRLPPQPPDRMGASSAYGDAPAARDEAIACSATAWRLELGTRWLPAGGAHYGRRQDHVDAHARRTMPIRRGA